MNRFAVALAAVAMLALPATGQAAQCRNAQGHFVKCAPAAAAKPSMQTAATRAPATAAKPSMQTAATRAPAKHAAPVRKVAGAGPRCRNAKGQFAKCGTPGAKRI